MAARRNSVLFLSPEPLGPSLTGPARRTVKLAEAVAERCRVTLAAPAPSTFPPGPFRTLETGPVHDQRLAQALAEHDVAVLQVLPSPRQLLTARRHARRLVIDMIAPLALEAAETEPEGARRRAVVRWRSRELVAHLEAADLVLCSNEKQRDLMLGAALAAGMLGDESRSPLERVAVVPHGLDDDPPPPTTSPLRGEAGPFSEDDRIAIWGGGMWSWLDPLTAIRAVERLRPENPRLKLAFVGYEHPDPVHRRAHERLAAEAVRYARERGLEDTVEFRPRWLSREEYIDHLADADLGLSLHAETLEGRFASRTRVLDYLSARLPVLCSRGDTMSEFVTRHVFGRVVEPQDVEGCAASLAELTAGELPRIDAAALAPLVWRNVARPLVEFCAEAAPPPRADRARALGLAARSYPSFARAVYRTTGAGSIARAAARRVRIRP